MEVDFAIVFILIAVVVLGLISIGLIFLFRHPIHITKDQCINFVHNSLPLSYDIESANWKDPENELNHPLQSLCSDGFKGCGLYYWRVPTSIMFGLEPIKLGEKSFYDEKKKRQALTIEVDNPAEERTQKETLKADSITGIILRGQNTFGWSSQGVDTSKFPSALHMFKLNKETLLEDNFSLRDLVLIRAKEFLKNSESDSTACYNKTHLQQLSDISDDGVHCDHIMKALLSILDFDKTTKYDFHARSFGGGPWRATSTYEALVRSCVPWYKRMLSPKITIDEMWGGKVLEYNKESMNTLVGLEFRNDGTKHYVRVTYKDTSPNETFFRAPKPTSLNSPSTTYSPMN